MSLLAIGAGTRVLVTALPRSIFRGRASWAFCLVTVYAATFLGQLRAQNLGEIAGFVRDASGAVVVSAQVTAVRQGTQYSRTATTNHLGGYVLPLMPPGSYGVTASAPGFQSQSVLGLEVGADTRARGDFRLDLGRVKEVVQVSALPPLIQRESAAVSTVIHERRLRAFPLNGRNYLSLVKTAGNVAAEMPGGGARSDRLGGERAEQTLSIAGQRQEANRFTLDGVENTDLNFNTYLVRPSLDALREVKVQTGVYSAQYGRSISQIIVDTKSGSNELHGTLFEFRRDESLDAKEWRLEGDKNPFVRNQFGFTVGGPLVRDRLFFFSNIELLRDRRTYQEQANIPTVAMRSGEFGGQSSAIFDPLTRIFEGAPDNEFAVAAEAFPNQTIPVSRQNRVALALLEFYPAPTRVDDDIFDNYRRNSSSTQATEQYLQRFDWSESDGSSWFGRFSHGNERLANPEGPFVHQTNRVETRAFQWAASNTRTFTPTVLNELRLAYNRFRNNKIGLFGFECDVGAELGIAGLKAPDPSAWGVPQIGLGDGLRSFGESTEGPWVNRNRMVQVSDNASVVKGAHSLRFGGELRRDHYNHSGAQGSRGQFTFAGNATADPANPGTTGYSFADFLLGANTQAGRIVDFADARLRATSWALYFQDTWRVARRLTVDFGLRYEYTPPFHDGRRGIVNAQVFDMGVGPGGLLPAAQTPILTRPGNGDFYEGLEFRYAEGIPTQVGDQFLTRRLVDDDGNDWAPRLGVAFSPTQRWTLRTGVGLFYSQDIGNARFDMARNLSGIDRLQANQQRPDSYLDDPWASAQQAYSCSGWDGVCVGRPFVLANVFERRTPYVWQWMVDIQRQLADSIIVEARYQGSAGHKLERTRAFNQAIERSGPGDRSSLLSRRPWPEYDTVQEVDGVVNSNYHALSLRAESRLSEGATFLVNYTWSKSIDDGSAIRSAGADRLFPADNYNLQAERGLSQFDVRHRLVASCLYELPLGPGKALLSNGNWISRIWSDWQIGGIVTLSTGSPSAVNSIGDRNNTGVPNYPDATGISPLFDEPTADSFWNIDAFDAASPELQYRTGNVGRSVLRSPGFANWDVVLIKDIRVGEDRRLQLRAEAFNAANHPNWFPPGRNVRSPTSFGRVFGARTMRELQLGVRFVF